MHTDTRPVVGFPGYVCTQDGRIFDEIRKREISIQYNTASGIKHAILRRPDRRNGGYRYAFVPVARIVWRAWRGDIPRGMCIAHKDGDRESCSIDNLWLTPRGPQVPYPGDEVHETMITIRKQLTDLLSRADYEVSESYVRSIVKNTIKNIGRTAV